ncbi:MAG: bifunctional 2-polyprenyl-6-hydroxyphenol methylase/3-demethylubiquinol 3-O-methyltransferase UbiG [Rhodospirillales bacterium]|jgi:2-polyprenyl-6-hydroxyphenyl methylase / 3-demethylubiquinone-9 3-methyltransferase|nr:bifunctional 2-polyprenyl-6-hydroxyphenol methylase/3-demethylubiquinol 3-O-methyltransferase UbiG [Rhodospirillales bacterium]MBT4040757.1 bifunctional 2-polyprenyl-6-hydroxyphenol methylase/3-demethylubiquinol 3-O-methyltransferase UbiG [Rhodospirillales bacterium]MBT4625942.1 bifunctional 2-polyprenyl-6-hydroxyphenol methylase/3-demethylubiquinol 3-O-methyltransferase UbiG [Rhodospirillales bacterium]MBT5350703.1 bifunctional 2-polyprenyl-6-hydroxyphenol methylase/3-demethylubiquinol 3-O-m
MVITSTASPEEIARFTAIADEWWDDSGKFRPLHMLNPVRMEFVVGALCDHFGRDSTADSPLKGLKLLDVGCGGGLASEPLNRLGADVTAIDAGEETIAVAATHARQSGLDINYRQCMPETLAAEGLSFDAVISLEVVEHVTDVNQFLDALSALVTPEGCLIMGTINRTIKSLAFAKIAAEYILRWVPAGTHDWNKFVRPSELANGLRPHGLDIKSIKGTVYNLANGDWRLGDDTAVNYLAYFSRQQH